eukprot:Gb_18032 [translate_table: standard]
MLCVVFFGSSSNLLRWTSNSSLSSSVCHASTTYSMHWMFPSNDTNRVFAPRVLGIGLRPQLFPIRCIPLVKRVAKKEQIPASSPQAVEAQVLEPKNRDESESKRTRQTIERGSSGEQFKNVKT